MAVNDMVIVLNFLEWGGSGHAGIIKTIFFLGTTKKVN
jgi:hypothetical protein